MHLRADFAIIVVAFRPERLFDMGRSLDDLRFGRHGFATTAEIAGNRIRYVRVSRPVRSQTFKTIS